MTPEQTESVRRIARPALALHDLLRHNGATRTPVAPTSITVIDIAPHGSFGDEAILFGLLETIRTVNPAIPVTLWTTVNNEASRREALGSYAMEFKAVPIGGSVRRPWLVADLLPAGALLIIPGADLIDGSYDRAKVSSPGAERQILAAAARRRGHEVLICNFSLSGTARTGALRALRSLDRMGVRLWTRDVESQRRLLRGSHSVVVPDLALMAPPVRARTPATLRIGVNPGGSSLLDSCQRVQWISTFLEQLQVAIGQRLDVVGIPHDIRPGVGDESSLAELGSRITGSIDKLNWSVASCSDARSARRVASGCELVVTSRLHLGIQSLAEGVPVIGLDYLDKFAGVLSGYDLPGYVADPVSPSSTKDALAWFLSIRGCELDNHPLAAIQELIRRRYGEIIMPRADSRPGGIERPIP